MTRDRRAHRRLRWLAFAAGLAFSACMILAQHPFALWGFSLLALAPLVWLAEAGLTRRAPSPPGPPPPNQPDDARGPHNAAIAHAARSPDPAPSALAPAAFAAIGTIPFYLFQHWWLWPVAGPGVPILVFLIILFPLAFIWTLRRLKQRWPNVPILLAAPLLWAGLEEFRGTIAFDGYPWYFLGHPLIDFESLAQSATAVGAIGISAVAALTGASLGWVAAKPSLKRAGVALTALFATAATLYLATWPERRDAMFGEPAPVTLRVGIVQTNLPQSNKMDWPPEQRIDDLLWFLEMTEEAARSGDPDLLVWPETMFPGSSLDDQARQAEDDARIVWNIDRPEGRESVAVGALARTLLERQAQIDIPMLVGAIGYDNVRYEPQPGGGVRRFEDASYNSVYLLHQGRVTARYDKVHLTPFGEVMPYISAWPWLERQLLAIGAAGMSFELSAGAALSVFDVPVQIEQPPDDSIPEPRFARTTTLRVVTPICFESTDPHLCRRLVNLARARTGWETPTLLVNPTNDGWFGPSLAGRRQHLQLARWRAIENRVSVVRAANTGISAAIDHRGRVIATGVRGPTDRPGVRGPEAFADGVLVAEVPLAGGITVYSWAGDWVGWGLMWPALAMVATACLPRRLGRKPNAEPAARKGR